MSQREFHKTVESILRDDSRYAAPSYVFVRMALDYTVKKVRNKEPQRLDRNVTTHELLDGVRCFALETFGPITTTLFEEWGVRTSRDIGEIVFNLVNAGALKKTDDDKIEDFDGVFDFHEAFEKPFLPN